MRTCIVLILISSLCLTGCLKTTATFRNGTITTTYGVSTSYTKDGEKEIYTMDGKGCTWWDKAKDGVGALGDWCMGLTGKTTATVGE